uniref:Transient receptor potential cation channel, subfamily M, member 2 n=1 Tax=Sinocyclocheilus grahami TaxID=75366 RepID=A0A672MJ60_SINGR
AIKPEDYMGDQWDRHRHVREVPTDAFGDLSFGGLGQKTGKYVRVSSDTSCESLYQLMTEHWKLRSPNLLISVTGGAKNFYIKTHLKDKFRRGLIKVAQTTGTAACISAQSCDTEDWRNDGCFPAYYSLDEQGQGHLSCLDINHTHFLLVDDGTYGHYGAEIELRARLEKLISQQSLGNRGAIQDIIRMPHLLTVFHIDEDKNYDVDVAILQALLKGASPYHFSDSTWSSLFCGDVFSISFSSQSCDLHPAMFSALVGDKPEFVRLLLENGVCVRKFLEHEDTLCELYAHLPACFFLRKLAKRVQGGKIRRGQEPPPGSTKISLSHVWSADTVWDPGRDLFLWAVVQNNTELAEIGWEQCRDCIAAALAASKILRKLAQESGEDDSEEAKEMRELASHYEKQAIGVFSECHSWDVQRAQKLLIRVSPSWGRSTCLWLALEANAKSFIAHSGVQALLTQIWCGELSVDNPHWKVLLCMIFFPLIYTGFMTFSLFWKLRHQTQTALSVS